jgi:hypothetical protein
MKTKGDKDKAYQKKLYEIVIAPGLSSKSRPKKGEHNQYAIDKKNSAAARKKLREEGRASEYKTKTIKLKKQK